jgi:hypothetical protein
MHAKFCSSRSTGSKVIESSDRQFHIHVLLINLIELE